MPKQNVSFNTISLSASLPAFTHVVGRYLALTDSDCDSLVDGRGATKLEKIFDIPAYVTPLHVTRCWATLWYRMRGEKVGCLQPEIYINDSSIPANPVRSCKRCGDHRSNTDSEWIEEHRQLPAVAIGKKVLVRNFHRNFCLSAFLFLFEDEGEPV